VALDDENRTNPEQIRKSQAASELAARLLEIGRECASHLREPYKSVDHGDLLYDERGLPK
jgi:antitoxin VapB